MSGRARRRPGRVLHVIAFYALFVFVLLSSLEPPPSWRVHFQDIGTTLTALKSSNSGSSESRVPSSIPVLLTRNDDHDDDDGHKWAAVLLAEQGQDNAFVCLLPHFVLQWFHVRCRRPQTCLGDPRGKRGHLTSQRFLPLVSAWTGEGEGLGGGYAIVVLPDTDSSLLPFPSADHDKDMKPVIVDLANASRPEVRQIHREKDDDREGGVEATTTSIPLYPWWWETLYTAPGNGSARLTFLSGGYTTLQGGSHASSGGPFSILSTAQQQGRDRIIVGTHHLANRADVYMRETHRRSTYSTYVSLPTFLHTPVPLECNLTDTWEVLAKPSSGTLLHCRIPFPNSVETVRRREAEVLARHGDEMAEALSSWWRRLAGEKGLMEWVAPGDGMYHQQASGNEKNGGGLFGEGEKGITGVDAWYVFCPLQGIYKVHTRLLHDALLLTDPDARRERYAELHQCEASSHSHASADRGEREDQHTTTSQEHKRETGVSQGDTITPGNPLHNASEGNRETYPSGGPSHPSKPNGKVASRGKDPQTVLEAFKRKYLRCTADFQHLLQVKEKKSSSSSSSLLQAAITSIGMYHEKSSRPRWNTALRAWEMWFPSAQQCSRGSPSSTPTKSSRRTATSGEGGRDENEGTGTAHPLSSSSSFSSSPRWRTRVLLRCYRDRGRGNEESRRTRKPRKSSSSHPQAGGGGTTTRTAHGRDEEDQGMEEEHGMTAPFVALDDNADSNGNEDAPNAATRSQEDKGAGRDASVEEGNTKSTHPPLSQSSNNNNNSTGGDGDGDGVPPDPEQTDDAHNYQEEEEEEEWNVGTDHSLTWRITEVQQRCLFEVELSSDMVCLWDDYLEQLRITPIPCVEIQ